MDVAVEHFKAGRFDEALEATEQVGRDDALRARAAYLAGEVSLARGDALGAQGYFQEAADKKPVAPVLASLGRAYLLQGKGAEAVEPLTKAVVFLTGRPRGTARGSASRSSRRATRTPRRRTLPPR